MKLESLNLSHREPAISESELLTQFGYGNKYTLQKIAFENGLPVPPIMNETESIALMEEGAIVEKSDSYSFYANDLFKDFTVYARGYRNKPFDMYAVDLDPTESTYRPQDFTHMLEDLNDSGSEESVRGYLRRNFHIENPEPAQFFLQKGSRAYMYFSVLTNGPYTYIAGNDEFGRGVNWVTYYEDRVTANDHWHFPNLDHTLLDISTNASAVLNTAFKNRTTNFHFKHDILWDSSTNEYSLVQSRVASRVLTEAALFQQNETIVEYLQSGVPIVSLEPREISQLQVGFAPDAPFVLELTNDKHEGLASNIGMKSLDLSNIAGLILPEYLRGGLLHHDGYRLIAYAHYWGLPISFSA